MASAQVLPNSAAAATSLKKQQQLEAGRKRLEEFRKKKAAARRSSSTSQPHSSDAGLHENQPSEPEHVRSTNLDGVGTSDGGGGSMSEGNETEATEFVHNYESGSNDANVNAVVVTNYNLHPADQESRDDDASSGPINDIQDPKNGANDNLASYSAKEIVTEENAFFPSSSVQEAGSQSSPFGNFSLNEALSNISNGSSKDFTFAHPVTSLVSFTNSPPDRSASSHIGNISSSFDSISNGEAAPSFEDSSSKAGKPLDGFFEYRNAFVPSTGARVHTSHLTGENGPSSWPSEPASGNFRFDIQSSSNQVTSSPAVTGRRSRPSFLDSIQTRVPLPFSENSSNSKVHPLEVPVASASEDSASSIIPTDIVGDSFRHGANELKHNFYSAKQNEDFSALEQHIEDLTQEKFSLQRALEASRVLADSLASENSTLTESYNQQAGFVHQLKSDMEKLQEEIKANLVELEAMKIEYGNVQLECNAADERAKLLASEVIGLEEKALKLRSNELKLERQLENSQSEFSSIKRKLSSLEKERQDLQQTISALQEEKKLLQSMLRKVPANGKFVDITKAPKSSKEVSTSTEDLDGDDEVTATDTYPEGSPAALPIGGDVSGMPLEHGSRLGLESSSLSIPPDQSRMIESINTLISELAMEKEELIQALSAESSQCAKLKDLNNELSRKLEVQTQRLELLTSQSLANESIPSRRIESRTVHENPAYADEGDEVVERVLGWIMKLFPGGPARRQTSKRL